MEPAIARGPAPIVFEDGFGTRHHTLDAAAQPLEVLTLRRELTAVASFEFSLRERVSRLAGFHHPCYAYVRGVERVDRSSMLAIVSDHAAGVRLSEVLAVAGRELLPLDIEASLCLIRQLVESLALLHETFPEVAHGAVAAERIIVTPKARLVLAEHVLGAAVQQIGYARDRYWQELRVALPSRAGLPRVDRRADVTQVGVVALALILGRPLGDDDYPKGIAEIAGRIGAVSATGGLEPLPAPIRAWLARALQIDSRNAFASAMEARAELDVVLGETDYNASPTALESFLAQYNASASRRRSSPAPSVPAAPVAAVAAVATAAPAARAQVCLSPNRRLITPSEPAEPQAQAEKASEVPMSAAARQSRRRFLAVAVTVIALADIGTLTWRRYLTPSVIADETGTLLVNTNPVGVTVIVDGQARGTTPISVQLPPGDHMFELVTPSDRRSIPVAISPGGQVSQFIEMPKVPSRLGELHVRTEPTGAKVTVDGHFFGTTPVTVSNLTPGVHVVVLENEVGSLQEEVTIEGGITASLLVPLKAPQGAPVSGWISVSSPVDVQLFENQHLLGSSRTPRIMVPVGRHDIEIVSDALGYRARRTVTVSPGQVSGIEVDVPKGSLSVNALPWAEVWIGGERIGETPIGNVTLPIGTHEVIFRHPELGEKRQTVSITMTGQARVSADLRKH